ncbi:MAG: hypothetical protein KJ622_15920 [Alphaproteobacteria bacterium]|nr:hypothetical protein [Alphaproteobacteria bacterium]
MTLARTLVIAAAAAAGFGLLAPAAIADDTGMAGIHSWMKVGRKTCFGDHSHAGNSSGKKSEKAALAAAIDDWQGFTAFEYGTDWAYYKHAHAKTKSCSQEASGWSCSIDAVPCNPRRR